MLREPVASAPSPAPNGRWKDVSPERGRPLAESPLGLPSAVEWGLILDSVSVGRPVSEYAADRIIFAQGDQADAVYFVIRGHVSLTVVSPGGKSAIVATLGPGDVFGDGCLVGQPVRMATATAMRACSLRCVAKAVMARVLRDSARMSGPFIAYILARLMRHEEDLVDQMFNPGEKRLARVLLRLSDGKDVTAGKVSPRISQEHLAQMVGSTRPRINRFMTKFRKLGFIAYGKSEGLTVDRSLKCVLEDGEENPMKRAIPSHFQI